MPELFKAMMSDQEVGIIDDILQPEFECLEFGGGYSTAYFPEIVKSWVTIEHDPIWEKRIRGMFGFNCEKNTELILTDLDHYIGTAINLGRKFDFILIDGEKREECLDASFGLLKPGGVILLHDAGRYEYAKWINKYPGEVLIEGEMPDMRVPKGFYLIRGLKLWKYLSA